MDVISTTPVTGGTINGDNEANDGVLEAGGYVHSVTTLSKRFELVAAARLDKHDRLEHAVVSPRVALTFKPTPSQHFRVTYNRAFATPANYQFFADETVQPLAPGLPYQLQLVGMPTTGISIPARLRGLAVHANAVVGDACCVRRRVGRSVVASRRQRDRAVAASEAQPLLPLFRALNPTSAQVGTQLAILNTGTGTFDAIAPASVADFIAFAQR